MKGTLSHGSTPHLLYDPGYVIASIDNLTGKNSRVYKSELPPLWSSGQSSWLQIRRPGFDSRH
jgi:hypothetical protein